MAIYLMRHGRPADISRTPLAPAHLSKWIEKYNLAEIQTNYPPQAEAWEVSRLARFVLCSSSPRARSSAAVLDLAPDLVDDLFLEVQLPVVQWRWPRLPPLLWTAFLRIAWLAGYAKNVESCQEAKKRAAAAAQIVEQYAVQGSVLLIGHGMFNRFIARALSRNIWQEKATRSASYWGTITLERR